MGNKEKSKQRIIEEIRLEMMKRPITPNLYAVPSLHLPMMPLSSPEEVLSHIKHENEKLRDIEREKVAKQLGRENIFRFGYVPLVISELAWDYADTVLDLAETMRMDKVRPLCREIKKLRASYLKYRNRYIDADHYNNEIENMYTFEKIVKDIFSTYIINLKCDLCREHPDLSEDSILYLIAIYQCWVVIKSLMLYAQTQSKKITKIVGHPIGNVIPTQVRLLADLIIEFVGDSPVSKEFERTQDRYIQTFATQIALINFSPINN